MPPARVVIIELDAPVMVVDCRNENDHGFRRQVELRVAVKRRGVGRRRDPRQRLHRTAVPPESVNAHVPRALLVLHVVVPQVVDPDGVRSPEERLLRETPGLVGREVRRRDGIPGGTATGEQQDGSDREHRSGARPRTRRLAHGCLPWINCSRSAVRRSFSAIPETANLCGYASASRRRTGTVAPRARERTVGTFSVVSLAGA